MFTHHFRGIAARAGAVTLLSLGLVAGMAGAPAMAQTQTARSHSGHSHTGQTTLAYTVMGDSYSAGSGAGGETGPCRQSTAGYANDVAALTGAALTNIACSGNTITDVTQTQVPQLSPATKLVTITAGGNDVAWTTAVGTCLSPASTAAACKTAVANSIHLMKKVPRNATTMLKAIKAKAPHARILYLGYPRLFEPENMAAPTFTPTQVNGVKLLNGAADLLNGVIAVTALSNRVAFVPVAYRFAGHAIPSAQPWLNYPPPFQIGEFPFHPNATGYLDGYTASLQPFLRW
ncbi:SGNH/GDSL hydrolase family protein [Arthrobacter sp. H35-D1]|uniref:SGNH/GDSL hydrolase family protein n=1 Tax=Arthrobacter sp. H35-D1 TaxID=3046202 RepID=UPI0024B9057A|nr:SGNH/GDSL hydrolase family protein [Arthrobacter sp. H35-D1]MDJ0313912.1 SGNH/GDSL hydrolase family protein [Arthrobacter sp. H35-D1]